MWQYYEWELKRTGIDAYQEVIVRTKSLMLYDLIDILGTFNYILTKIILYPRVRAFEIDGERKDECLLLRYM